MEPNTQDQVVTQKGCMSKTRQATEEKKVETSSWLKLRLSHQQTQTGTQSWKETTHVASIQEHCLTPAQIKFFKREAKQNGNIFEGGPLDPEHGRVSAGVGILCMERIAVYPIP